MKGKQWSGHQLLGESLTIISQNHEQQTCFFLSLNLQQPSKQEKDKRTAQIWQILGERIDLDGQINEKLYEILS